MSGAQPKAAVIAKGICIVAEINQKPHIKDMSKDGLMKYTMI